MNLHTNEYPSGSESERPFMEAVSHLRTLHSRRLGGLKIGDWLSEVLVLAETAYNFVPVAGSDHKAGGVFVDGGEFCVWGMDRGDHRRPVLLSLKIDKVVVFQQETVPAEGEVFFRTGYRPSVYRTLAFTVDDQSVEGPPYAVAEFWPSEEQRQDIANFLTDVRATHRRRSTQHRMKQDIPGVMKRLDRSDETTPGRTPAFARYFSERLGTQDKPSTAASVADWVIADVFEDQYKREVFCLSEQILAILKEPIFNRRVLKQDISLALFAFWRRHYSHIDVFSDDGLRLVQFKFATAPFISLKNNIKLISDGCRKSLSSPAEMFRTRELAWSWYWLFYLEDLGRGESLRDEQFTQMTSFKEVVMDTMLPQRLSFNPLSWRAHWGSGGAMGFTRFDLSLISILAGTSKPGLEIAAKGPLHWSERLHREFYSALPELSVLSTSEDTGSAPAAAELPTRDLVVVGHPNKTGLGRNLSMFMDATAEFAPLVFSADDGSCFNPDADYDPLVGVRARVVLLCVNADRAPEVIARFASLCEGAHIIGFYLWESERPPVSHQLGALAVDEIWAPTTYVAEAYRKITSVPVSVVKKGLLPRGPHSQFLDRFRESSSEFIFLCAAEFSSSIVRKNPFDVVKAFKAAFQHDEPVRLLIKVREINPGHWSNVDQYWEEMEQQINTDPRISIIEGNLTEEEYNTLLATTDALVSLHRSEGFGYVIADAMMIGRPVVVSDYSGSQDFCDEQDAYLVPVKQIPAPPENFNTRGYIGDWASPDIEAAAAALFSLYSDPLEREKKAALGQARVAREYDFDAWQAAIVERIRKHL